ncbi:MULTISPECIES: ubiquitin-like small modifier protein 1 [Actinokineospora]|uniref:Molybdopterin synthase sulfur carrier subunit n=1 Tax=Actinokineospora fastidiosa TaxID=1816 RepID=A0A918GPS5_9PSEU|nr:MULTISPECIES: ubiquitin-like small modifier protein 1 [Actinokineospora]UVS81250.1 9.5 kDa culture filtrate antigen cfp10A [Actinokineospora sp. UTMC 2448]GGS52379.1 molybdopterin synthase sulfur carrier subunit [Actinokineospora fastidiosa]
MTVTVRLPNVLRPRAGDQPKLDVDLAPDATLTDLLDVLAHRHPALERRLRDEQGALRRYVNFFIDGEECRQLQGKDTRLRAGAEIQIIPSVAGG